ncbi:MAG: DinB family protein, partial [bacterium]|nr:DinB family protein [bacterium]
RLKKTAPNGPDPEEGSLLDSLDLYAIEAAKTKYNAPKWSVPHPVDRPKEKLVEELKQSRSEFRKFLPGTDAYNLAELVFPHPAYGKLNFYQWILFLGKHEERHLNQMKNMLKV